MKKKANNLKIKIKNNLLVKLARAKKENELSIPKALITFSVLIFIRFICIFFEKKYSQNLHMFKKITNVGRRLVM